MRLPAEVVQLIQRHYVKGLLMSVDNEIDERLGEAFRVKK